MSWIVIVRRLRSTCVRILETAGRQWRLFSSTCRSVRFGVSRTRCFRSAHHHLLRVSGSGVLTVTGFDYGNSDFRLPLIIHQKSHRWLHRWSLPRYQTWQLFTRMDCTIGDDRSIVLVIGEWTVRFWMSRYSNNVTVCLTSMMVHWQVFTMNCFKWEMVVCQIPLSLPAEVDANTRHVG